MKTISRIATALVIACSVACSQTDSGVTTKVKAKFAQDDLVKAHEINVTTHEGVVTLSGEVETNAARQQALRLARETEGVTNVVDELKVETAATRGHDADVDVDNDIEHGVRATGDAIRKGVKETGEAAKKAGKATRDAVTDDNRDSDHDGK